MRTSNTCMYALRLTFGQSSQVSSSASSDRVVTRSAAMLAAFGIALSSFSLKQLLASNQATSSNSLRKF